MTCDCPGSEGVRGSLTFDPTEEKSNDVTLNEKHEDEGAQWILTPINDGDGERAYVIRAKRKSMKGWYLDYDEKNEIKVEVSPGNSVVAYPLILQQDNRRVVKFDIGGISP